MNPMRFRIIGIVLVTICFAGLLYLYNRLLNENERLHLMHLVDQACIDAMKCEDELPPRRTIDDDILCIVLDRDKYGMTYKELSEKY